MASTASPPVASVPGSRIANSSPPMRATVAGFSTSDVEHLAGTPQQRVAGGVAELVVGGLQAVEIGNDDR